MDGLKLNFLDKQPYNSVNPIEQILDKYGQAICEYAKGYFNYVVVTVTNGNLQQASLYIIAQEIGYDYRILELSYEDVENVTLRFFTLKTSQTEVVGKISINNNWEKVYKEITKLLNDKLANATFRFLIDQINLKRESREE